MERPANWHGGVLHLYFSRRDSRTLVPKRRAWMGMTVNLAHPAGVAVLVAILGLALFAMAIGVR